MDCPRSHSQEATGLGAEPKQQEHSSCARFALWAVMPPAWPAPQAVTFPPVRSPRPPLLSISTAAASLLCPGPSLPSLTRSFDSRLCPFQFALSSQARTRAHTHTHRHTNSHQPPSPLHVMAPHCSCLMGQVKPSAWHSGLVPIRSPSLSGVTSWYILYIHFVPDTLTSSLCPEHTRFVLTLRLLPTMKVAFSALQSPVQHSRPSFIVASSLRSSPTLDTPVDQPRPPQGLPQPPSTCHICHPEAP